MYKLTLLSLASLALAAPAPQGVGLCNPVALPFPDDTFQLAAYNPADQSTVGLAIRTVSRGAKILVASPSTTLSDAAFFSYDTGTSSLCAEGSGCDDGSLNNPLLFGQPGPVPANGGEITLKTGYGCFHQHNQLPLFAVGGPGGNGDGTTEQQDWNGWVFCQASGAGIYWNGGEAAPEGCVKVALQVFNDLGGA